MYKNMLRFSIALLIIFIILSIYILIHLTIKSNVIIIDPYNYPKVLDEVTSNIDKYVGKKIKVSGYVYIQDDFSPNRFVIAQNVFIYSVSPDEPVIVGFLCENQTKTPIEPYENITIFGKIDKCIYNELQYPIILVEKIT